MHARDENERSSSPCSLVLRLPGFGTNTWFWRRYVRLNREQPDAIMETQGRLYRAKVAVDASVIIALSSVAVRPDHPFTPHVDVAGSINVALYLLWSASRAFASRARTDAPRRWSRGALLASVAEREGRAFNGGSWDRERS